ncbi:MAG: hypothetical protein ABI417_13140 [Coleofasciculaceae cyanobacterium]
MEAKLERHFARQKEASQKVLTAAKQIYGNATPIDIIRDKLASV